MPRPRYVADPQYDARVAKFLSKVRANPQAKRVFVQGDSWFTLPGGDYKPGTNGPSVWELLNSDSWLQKVVGDSKASMAVLSCARVGTTIAKMPREKLMRDMINAVLNEGINFDAFLVSGGGNDLLDKVEKLITGKGDGKAELDKQVLEGCIGDIEASWTSLRNTFAKWSPKAPILTHGYGHVTPTLR